MSNAHKRTTTTTTHGTAWEYVAARTFGGAFRAVVRDIATRAASQSWVRIGDLSTRVEQDLDDILSSTRESFVTQWSRDLTGTETHDARQCVAAKRGDAHAIIVGGDAIGAMMIPRRGDDDDMRAVSVERLLYRAAYRAAERAFPRLRRCEHCRDLPTACRTCVNTCAGTGATLTADAWESVAANYAAPRDRDDIGDTVRMPRDMRRALRGACDTLAEAGISPVSSNGRPAPEVWEALSMAAGHGIGAAATRRMRETYRALAD
jgi:hypothetical protein